MKRDNLDKAKRTIEDIKVLEDKINLLTQMGDDSVHESLKMTLSRAKIGTTIEITDRGALNFVVKPELEAIRKEIARLEAILEGL